MRSDFRTLITWTIFCGLAGIAIFMMGCGGGGSSPVGPGLSEPTTWTTSLTHVQQALKVASGSSWTAGETSVSLGFSQEEARTLCGMISDPLLSTFSTSIRGDAGISVVSDLSPVSQSLPRRFSWLNKDGINWGTPVKSQGKYGTCVAFASIAALETGLKVARNQATATFDLSEWHLWSTGTQGKNPSPGGWFPSGAAEALKQNGVVSEDLCPYSAIPIRPTPPSDSRSFSISDWSVVSGRNQLKQALLAGPVIASMRVWSDFCFYKSGVYTHETGQELGDHAILLIGYDDDQECWIGQNSWGASWGENGFFRIKFGQINDVGLRFSVTSGLNDSTPVSDFPAPILNLGPYVREVTATSAMVCWSTDQSTVSQVEYGAGAAFSRVSAEGKPSANHSVKLMNLAEKTAYQFRVSSKTPTGQAILSNIQSFVTLSVASSVPVLPVIYNITASKVTKESAVITWKTDIPATSKVRYSTTAGATDSSDLRLLVDHSVTLNNLFGGTTYSYYVEASATNLVAVSETNLFTTLDNTPPVISQVSVPAATLLGKQANVVWLTDELSTSQVEYGLTSAYGFVTTLNSNFTYGHLVSLTNLLPQTTYHYRVRSKDANNNESAGPNGTFTTPDSTPPVLSAVRASPITGTTATINFTTNEVATVQIEYGPSGFNLITPPETNTSFATVLSGLTPRVAYKCRVRAKDAAGNESVSAELVFMTVDSTPPVITNISVPSATLTGTTAEVTWLTDEPSTTLVEYGLSGAYGLVSSLNLAKTNGHLAKLFNLLPNTTYHYRVLSKDTAGNESVSGNNTFTTTDSLAPALTNIRVLPITGTSANVSFATSKPSTILIEYGVQTYSGLATTSVLATTHDVLLTGLSPRQTYRYRIYAKDSAGNESVSANLSFVTLDTVPPVIYGINVLSVTNSSAIINWNTDKLANSQVVWGLSAAYGEGPTISSVLTKAHSIKINLNDTSASIWRFQISSTDIAGNVATSSDQFFTVPLSIYNINVPVIGTNSATITWTSNATASSQVDYGISAAYGNQAINLPYLSTGTQNHSVSLSNLIPFTTYYFRVRSTDQAGKEVVSKGFSFKTNDSGAPTISRVAALNTSNTSVVVTWATDKNTSAMVEYGTSTGVYVSQNISTAAWSTAHTVYLVGLLAGRTYYFRVKSVDASNNASYSSEGTFVTSGTSSPLISAVQAVATSDTTASITWTTDQPTSTQVEYVPTGVIFSQTPLDTALTTTHVVTLTNLSPYTQYRFRVRSRNQAGLESVSAESLFRTPDVNPPQIYDLFVQNVTANSAGLVWKTDENSDTQVEYGTQTYNLMTGLNSSMAKTHLVTLTGLQENATYVFRVKSKDLLNQVGSATGQFVTLDKTPPTLANINLSGLTANSVWVNWTTVEPGTSQVDYGLSATYGFSVPSLPFPLPVATVHSVQLIDLNPQSTYNFRIRCSDTAGNVAYSQNFTFTTLDTVPPVISGINVVSITATSAVVIWSTNENADSLLSYGPSIPYASSSFDATLAKTHSITINNLSEKTTYLFRVTSVDGSANSTTSDEFTFTTLDRTPPVISAATAAVILESGATITWTTDELATTKLEYGFNTQYGYVMQVSTNLATSHSVVIDGLNPFTTYHYRVRSTDSSGNERISGNYTFTTQDTLIIQSVVVSASNISQATITWKTNTAAICDVWYGNVSPPVNGPVVEDSTPWGTSHSITIPLPGAVSLNSYYFQIRARTGSGVTTISTIRYFAVP